MAQKFCALWPSNMARGVVTHLREEEEGANLSEIQDILYECHATRQAESQSLAENKIINRTGIHADVGRLANSSQSLKPGFHLTPQQLLIPLRALRGPVRHILLVKSKVWLNFFYIKMTVINSKNWRKRYIRSEEYKVTLRNYKKVIKGIINQFIKESNIKRREIKVKK